LASYILLKIIIIAFSHSNETILNGEKENVFWNPDFSQKHLTEFSVNRLEKNTILETILVAQLSQGS